MPEPTMTVAGLLASGMGLVSTYGVYLAIGVAVPLGIKLVFVARKLVVKR